MHDKDLINSRIDMCPGWVHVLEYSNNNKEHFGNDGFDVGTAVYSFFNVNDRPAVTVFSNGFNILSTRQASII